MIMLWPPPPPASPALTPARLSRTLIAIKETNAASTILSLGKKSPPLENGPDGYYIYYKSRLKIGQ